MRTYHLRRLPSCSTLLAGHTPRNTLGFQSDHLQISYINSEREWRDSLPHAHQTSDECYLVLKGQLELVVEGEEVHLGPRDYCCLPFGIYHQVMTVTPPIECLIIRGPSVADKQYLNMNGEVVLAPKDDILGMLQQDTKSDTDEVLSRGDHSIWG